MTEHHLISVLVENKPGVLARISSMFARRGFNIHSLAVGPTTDPALSRITLVVDGPKMEQIIKQLYKLIHVVKVIEMAPDQGIEREVMLVRVVAEPDRRGEIMDTAGILEAKAVDVGVKSITFEMSGPPAKLADFLELMSPYGIVDLVKSGRIAITKDPKAKERRSRLRSA